MEIGWQINFVLQILVQPSLNQQAAVVTANQMILFFLFFFFTTVSYAAPVLQGRITDKYGGEGLLGVNLQLTEALRGTSTDEKGNYKLQIPSAGEWTIRVTHLGYQTILKKFTIAEKDSLELNFFLEERLLEGCEVIVTEQARETTARLSTTRVEVVNSNEARKRLPGTLDKMLDAVPGLEVHRTGGAVVSNLSIRGSSDMLGGGVGNRTLLLVDGKPAIISDTDGAAWWLYPEDIVERVEVVKGAYSALYGSNAMGGVVNLITKTPQHREYTSIHASYGVHERPPDWMKYTAKQASLNTLSFSHSNSIGRFGYFANASRRAGDGWREGSSYDNASIFTKLKYDYSPTRGISFSALYLNGENDYPHSWINSIHPLEIRDDYTNDLQRKQSFSADLVYRRIESASSGYTVRLFYNRDNTKSLFNPSYDTRPNENIPVDFETGSLSQKFGLLEQSTRLLPYHNTLVFGVDAVADEINGKPESYLYGKQGGISLAAFAQNDYHPVEKFHFTLGGRFDYRHVRHHKTTNQFSPKAGLAYEIKSDLVLRGSVGQAFRNPSFAEMFLRKVGTQEYEFEPNPDLQPETANFAEAGFNYQFEDKAMLDGAIFSYKYSDMIRWQTLEAGRYKTENLSTAKINGAELSLKTAWPKKFKQSASFAYLDTDIDGKGPLTYVPKWRAYYSASYELGKTELGMEIRSVAKTDTVIFYQNDAPDAYTLFDFRVAFQFSQSTCLTLYLQNAENVFYEEMERYRMPPRTLKLDLLYEFDVEK